MENQDKKFAFVEQVYASLEGIAKYCEDPETIELFLSYEDQNQQEYEFDQRLLTYYAFYARALLSKLEAIDFKDPDIRSGLQLPSGITIKVAMAFLYMQDLAERIYEETDERATDFAINVLEMVDKCKILFEEYDPFRMSAVPDPIKNMLPMEQQEHDMNKKKRRIT